MGNRPHRLDMTMMYAVHDALRREAEHIARLSARAGDDPWRVLRTAAGWEMFKAYLRVHHTTEDDVLWPAMHEALTERPDGLALLELGERGFQRRPRRVAHPAVLMAPVRIAAQVVGGRKDRTEGEWRAVRRRLVSGRDEPGPVARRPLHGHVRVPHP